MDWTSRALQQALEGVEPPHLPPDTLTIIWSGGSAVAPSLPKPDGVVLVSTLYVGQGIREGKGISLRELPLSTHCLIPQCIVCSHFPSEDKEVPDDKQVAQGCKYWDVSQLLLTHFDSSG